MVLPPYWDILLPQPEMQGLEAEDWGRRNGHCTEVRYTVEEAVVCRAGMELPRMHGYY